LGHHQAHLGVGSRHCCRDHQAAPSSATAPPRATGLHQPPTHKRVSVQRWHQLIGSVEINVTGPMGLFSVLQDSLERADRNRVWHMAAKFRTIADSLHTRRTRIQELIPGKPSFIGACNACGTGMGGVWFTSSTEGGPRPILWRQHYPAEVQSALVTAERPHGTISISDLELTALIAHKDMLSPLHQVVEHTIWTACPATPTWP
jgi:hypothetical protein